MAEIKWVSLALQPPVTTRITHPSLYISSLVNSWSLDASHRKSWKTPPTSNVNQAMTILKSFRSSLQTNVIVYNTIISAHEKGAREGDGVVAGDVVGTADIIIAKMQPGMRTSRIDDVYHWATFNKNSCDTQLLNEAVPFFPTIQGDPTVAELPNIGIASARCFTLPSWPVGGEQWQLATQILGKLPDADLQQA